MMAKKPLNAIDELKLAASSLSLAIAQTIHESDKSFPKRLIPRVEKLSKELQAASIIHAAEVLQIFLNVLRDSKNFPS